MKMSFKYLTSFLALVIISGCFQVPVLAHSNETRELKGVKVGLVSSLKDRWGAMGYHFVKMAISDFYHQHPSYKTRLLLKPRDSLNDVVISAAQVEDLIKNERVVAIIGPETSQEAQFDISLGERSHVPIITYSAMSPLLSSPYFIQATQDDSSQVQAITAIIQAFGWREVTLVYANNEFGRGIVPFLVDALQEINTRIPYRCILPTSASDDRIEKELYRLRNRQTRVFVVHMNGTFASRFFSLASKYGMMSSDYVWIITSNIANTLASLNPEVIRSMQGVLGVETYVPKSPEVKSFDHHHNGTIDLSNLPMSLYGLWAYDATFMLAEAVEQFRDSSFTFTEMHSSSSGSDLSTFGVSDVGSRLIKRLLKTSFQGLSGNFSLVNGRLQTSTFEIINVIGTREKSIGFWTLKKGLVRTLDADKAGSTNSTSRGNLGSIIWPGDGTEPPRGWATPTKEKPLRVVYPKKAGYTEFVKASNDSSKPPTGFVIDLFEAVAKNLPYDLSVTYTAFEGSYDDLISQVYYKRFDAAVGDVPIIANRSLYVDFALPYMESDVVMVVPAVKDSKADKTWAFLKPLSWRLWVTSLSFFMLIAVVVWVNEYQINDEFRAESGKAQIGLCLFYSFSTLVFSNKEHPKSNLSRVVMGLWVFTLLLLTQSYTASLASMLTAEKLEPAYTDVDELLRSGKKVGYQHGTFIFGYLHRLGFEDSKIISYKTVEELKDLLSKGGEGGGIDAAFDEGPYVKLFLARYCNQYMTVVPPMSKTDGFAFAFPIGSPLVSDISRAVLNVTEGELMEQLWKKWMNKSEECPIDQAKASVTSSSTLDLDSFVALFAITGGVSFGAVVWKLAAFFYENRQVLRRSGSMTFNARLQELNRSFHTKKVLSPTGSVIELEFQESSRGSSPPRSSASEVEFVVFDVAGMTPANSPRSSPPPPPPPPPLR